MDEKTFITSCKEFFPDLQISPQNLKNPTVEFVFTFYKQVLEELGADLQNLHQIQSSQLRGNFSLESHQDLVPILNLFKSIQLIFNNIGCSRLEFCINDLLEPTPKRTLKLMASMMNFLLYCDSEMAKLAPKFKEMKEKKQDYEKCVETRNELRKKINQQSTDRARRLEEKKELEAAIKTLNNKFTALSVELNERKALQKEAKAKHKDKERCIEKALYHVKTLRNELAQLETQIVNSPEELQDEFNKLKEEKEEAKVRVDNLRQQIEPKNKTLEKLNVQVDAQEIRMKDLNEILELHKIIQELKSEIAKQKKKIENYSEDSHAKLKNLERQLNDEKEELVGLEIQWTQQERALYEASKAAEAEYIEIVKKFDEGETKLKKLKRDIDKAEMDINDFEEKFKQIVRYGEEANRELKARTEKFHTKTSRRIDKLSSLKNLL